MKDIVCLITRQQLQLEIEALGARLDVAQQRLQTADGQRVASEECLNERLKVRDVAYRQGGGGEVLGLKRTTPQAKMKKLGIKRFNQAMPN